jgi:hypothetical protein
MVAVVECTRAEDGPARSVVGRRRVAILIAAILVGALLSSAPTMASPASARSGDDATSDPARELAERYVPVVGLQTQREPCGPGEPYLPTSALEVTEQPGVMLRDASGRVITEAPTAADLAAASDDWHIDYPGDALRPGCDFERWLRSLGPPATAVHARVVVPADHPDRVVLQYWFFWIYNEWNNLHEGDWEMMQLVFEARSPEEALASSPISMGLSQHEGAERAEWGDVQLRDDRPVVFPAGGSHAMFFDQDRFLGKSADAGFGCDDTRAPTTFVTPEVIMLPAVDAVGDDAWLQWTGRWGERHPSFKNGPTGPIDKGSWDDPIGWIDGARSHSLRAPDFGNDVTDFFCTATERVSLLLVHWFDTPWLFASTLLAVVFVAVLVGRRTRWSPRVLQPMVTRRRSGQIVTSAAALLLRERRRFAPVALAVFAAGLLAALVRQVLLLVPAFGDANRLLDGDSVSQVFFALVGGSVVVVPVGIVAASVSTAIAVRTDGGVEPQSIRTLLRDRGVWSAAAFVVLFAVLLGPLTFVIGALVVARWGVAPVVALRQRRVAGSLRRSASLTKGQRVRCGTLLVSAALVATLLGPLLGSLILIAVGTSFGVVNVVSATVSAITVPWLAIVEVMLHGDLLSRAEDATTDPSFDPADGPADAASAVDAVDPASITV